MWHVSCVSVIFGVLGARKKNKIKNHGAPVVFFFHPMVIDNPSSNGSCV